LGENVLGLRCNRHRGEGYRIDGGKETDREKRLRAFMGKKKRQPYPLKGKTGKKRRLEVSRNNRGVGEIYLMRKGKRFCQKAADMSMGGSTVRVKSLGTNRYRIRDSEKGSEKKRTGRETTKGPFYEKGISIYL